MTSSPAEAAPAIDRAKWDQEMERKNFEYHCEQVLDGLLLRRAQVQTAIETLEAVRPLIDGRK